MTTRSGADGPSSDPRPSRRHFLAYAGAATVGAAVGGTVVFVRERDDDSSDEPVPSVPSERGSGVDGYVVTEFDADPDDASEAFNAAVAAAARDGGGIVRVPTGRWSLRRPVELASNVTLQGQSHLGTILAADGASPVLLHERDVVGATVEHLTVEAGGAASAIAYEGGASYCALRRLRLSDAEAAAIELRAGRYDRMYLEDLFVEHVDGHGVDVDANDAVSVFITGLSVRDFGRSASDVAYALRLRARAHVCQVEIGGVRERCVGVGFLAGSEYSTLTNYFIELDGGDAHTGADRDGVALGSGSVR